MASYMSDTKVTIFTIADKLCKHETFSQNSCRRRMSRHLLSKSVNAIWTLCFSRHILSLFSFNPFLCQYDQKHRHIYCQFPENTKTNPWSLSSILCSQGLHNVGWILLDDCISVHLYNKYTCMSKKRLFVIDTSIIHVCMYMHYMDTEFCRELENFSLLFEKLL